MSSVNFPRVELAHLPTPFEHLKRLSAHLGGPNIYVKRDDCTGLAGGGNKTRKFEFLDGGRVGARGGYHCHCRGNTVQPCAPNGRRLCQAWPQSRSVIRARHYPRR